MSSAATEIPPEGGISRTLVRPMQFADLPSVVTIHHAAYPDDHDSTHMPARLLENFYRHCLAVNRLCYVVIVAEQIIGFLIAGERVDEAIQQFQRRNILGLVGSALSNRQLFKAALRTARDRVLHGRVGVAPPPMPSGVKLLSIAVHPDHRRQGAGRAVVARLHQHLRETGHESYTLAVRKTNDPSNTFFRSIGAVLLSQSDISFRYRVELARADVTQSPVATT